MSDLGFDDPDHMDDPDDFDDLGPGGTPSEEASPICPWCGVSALPPEPSSGTSSICENADCDSFGEAI